MWVCAREDEEDGGGDELGGGGEAGCLLGAATAGLGTMGSRHNCCRSAMPPPTVLEEPAMPAPAPAAAAAAAAAASASFEARSEAEADPRSLPAARRPRRTIESGLKAPPLAVVGDYRRVQAFIHDG